MINKLLFVTVLFLGSQHIIAQTTESQVILTAPWDQIKFEVPDESRYFLMSKPANNYALALYSPEDGGYFWHTERVTGNFIFKKGNIGIGQNNPSAKLHLNGNMKVPFIWNLTESDYGRPIIETGWLIDAGDFISIMHGGNNNNTNTFGMRVSDINGFEFGRDDYNVNLFKINPQGLVGIGTTNPSHKLDVNGTIHAIEVLVDLNFPGPDYVFEEDYDLTSLEELDTYIKENKHLPEVPSAAQMREEGVNVVEMEMLLLKKVEELTLHLIDLKNENECMKLQIELLNDKMKER